jgi:hypothetical protein
MNEGRGEGLHDRRWKGPERESREDKSFQERRPRAGSPLEEERGSGAWPVIRLEEGPARRVRVIGSLQRPASKLLSDVVSRGPVILDLSEVDHADGSGVLWLSELPPETCTLVSCPTWLALWLERVRRVASERR